MRPVVLAVALTGLICVTGLAADIPTNDVGAPGHIPTSDVGPAPTPPPSPSSTSTSSSVALATVILAIVTLTNR